MFFALFCYGCEETQAKKETEVMYAVKYTLEYKDGPKDIIELVYVPDTKCIGIFCTKDKKNGIYRLIMKDENGFLVKELCATGFRISSYGIIN